jgi:Tfp pilus tip-associated adhesin PilY1
MRRTGRNHCHLLTTLADKEPIQTVEAEFSTQILLWRERKRDQNADMGNTYCKPPIIGHKKTN